MINLSLPQREIKFKIDLQAIAVSVTLEKEITLSSVYIPPSFALSGGGVRVLRLTNS